MYLESASARALSVVSLPAQRIHSMSDRFKMGRVDAATMYARATRATRVIGVAHVVQLQPIGDRAVKFAIGQLMRITSLTNDRKAAVSGRVQTGQPKPARVRLLNFPPEPLLPRTMLLERRTYFNDRLRLTTCGAPACNGAGLGLSSLHIEIKGKECLLTDTAQSQRGSLSRHPGHLRVSPRAFAARRGIAVIITDRSARHCRRPAGHLPVPDLAADTLNRHAAGLAVHPDDASGADGRERRAVHAEQPLAANVAPRQEHARHLPGLPSD